VDPLTHTLLGASVSYAVFGRRLGRTAALVGAVAAFVPDADVFVRSATDPLLAIEHHRGFTHSLLFAPVGAALVACLWLFRPAWRERWAELWHCAVVAYLSHGLLDAATTYGTQLLWPLSSRRFGWDLISIIDPIFTLALAVGLILGLRRQSLRPTAIALGFAGFYLLLGGVQQSRALEAQRELAHARGHSPERIRAMPTIGNNLVWRGLYLHRGRVFSDRIRVGWFSRATWREGWNLPLVQLPQLTLQEHTRNQNRSFERFAWFSDDWVVRNPRDLTVLSDARYTMAPDGFDPIWGIRFTTPGTPHEAEWVDRSRDRRIGVHQTWQEIIGRDPAHQPVRK
jgi:inner membrane protein